jgi:hypothetical protein
MTHLFRNERSFMNAIASNARQLGYLVFHPEISQGSVKGYPDLTIVGHGAVFFIETKFGPKARVTEAQQAWLDALIDARQAVRLAYPEDFEDIMNDLQAAYEAAFRQGAA